MQGPPFAVDAHEVHHLYDREWRVTQLACRDIFSDEPSLASRGVTALSTGVYQLQRR